MFDENTLLRFVGYKRAKLKSKDVAGIENISCSLANYYLNNIDEILVRRKRRQFKKMANEKQRELTQRERRSRYYAIMKFCEEYGAENAAREFGITRQRVYQIVERYSHRRQ